MPRLPTTTKMLALCVALVLSASVALAADEVCLTGTCLANGDTLCDRATGSCPPCMYAISGGYSCYGKIGNACPYPDTLTICSEAAPATRAPVTAAPVTAAPATAAPVTAAPVVVTAAPVVTPAEADSSATTDATTPEATTTPVDDDVKTTTTQTPKAVLTVGTVAPSNGTQPVATPSSAPVSTETQDALATDTKAAPKESPQFVNIMIIVGAAVGVAVVALFIVRRVRQRREMPMDMGFDDLGFKSPPRGGKEFSTAPNSSRFGGDQPNRFTTNTQTMTNRIDFSTLEPENPMVTRTKSRHQSYASSAPSSEMEDNVSELEFSVGVGSSTRSHQYVNHAEDASGRARAKSRVRGIEKSLIQNHYPELVGSYNSDVGSIACSERSDDFDIVDPGAIRPGERRNTETLVADGRFRQFSTASLAESFVSEASTEQSSQYSNSVYI